MTFFPGMLVGCALIFCASCQYEPSKKTPQNQPGLDANRNATGLSTDSRLTHVFELSRQGRFDDAINELSSLLNEFPEIYQQALIDPELGALRDDPRIRDAFHEAAIRHRISNLILPPEHEPGEWIEIEVQLVDENGRLLPDGVVHVFATDEQGRYHPTVDGERMPRLFGTLVSDEHGRCVFRTVRPGPYPGTRNARHIHISAVSGTKQLAVPHYAVFDDDPLLAEPQNAEQREEAVRINMNVVDGKPRGTLTLPLR